MVYKPTLRWPGRCLLCGLNACGEERGAGRDLCATCALALSPLGPHCQRCALPLPATEVLCGRCLRAPPAFDAARASLCYEFHAAALVQALKYRRQRAAARLLAGLLCDTLHTARAAAEVDALVPLPLHWRRQFWRGFNQSELLADILGRRLRRPLRTDLLRRQRHTPPQQSLDATARARNLRDAFVCTGEVSGLRLALVDDVITTGASAAAAARALKRAGAARVEIWAVARTP